MFKKCEKLKEKGNNAFKSGKYDDAIQFYTESMDIDKNNKILLSVSYASRSTAYAKKNDYNKKYLRTKVKKLGHLM